MATEIAFDIEELLQEPCWVIDCLPRRVPKGSEGRYFAVEQLLLGDLRGAALRRSFASVLLKLYCYHDLVVFRDQREEGERNPSPAELEGWVMSNQEHLCVALPSERVVVVLPTSSTCMELYGLTPQLLDEVRAIASSCGLFVWRPDPSPDQGR